MLHRASLPLIIAACLPPTHAADLFDGFGAGWRERWRVENFLGRATRYEVAEDGSRLALRARSDSAHAGFLREHRIPSPSAARLSWRWKVVAPLSGNMRERERAGDDYAARVFVVFETSVLPLRTRAINYVWAAHEPRGAVFPSPYTRNVAMIVVRSGAAGAGAWQSESRDVLADYRAYFGAAPDRISAVAVMTDTDNTGGFAEAFYADLALQTDPPPRR